MLHNTTISSRSAVKDGSDLEGTQPCSSEKCTDESSPAQFYSLCSSHFTCSTTLRLTVSRLCPTIFSQVRSPLGIVEIHQRLGSEWPRAVSYSAGQAGDCLSLSSLPRELELGRCMRFPGGVFLELALFLRAAAAVGVEWAVQRRSPGRVCLFDDAAYYWLLAGKICSGGLLEDVGLGRSPHFTAPDAGLSRFPGGLSAGAGRSSPGRSSCPGRA